MRREHTHNLTTHLLTKAMQEMSIPIAHALEASRATISTRNLALSLLKTTVLLGSQSRNLLDREEAEVQEISLEYLQTHAKCS